MDATSPAPVRPVVAEPAAQDAHGWKPELVGQAPYKCLIGFDQIGAALRVLAGPEAVAHGVNAAAHAVARLEDGDPRAVRLEGACRREAGKPGARNDHVYAGKLRAGSHAPQHT